MKVLITGSSGFIGSHLHDALGWRGHQVEGWDKEYGETTADLEAFTKKVWDFLPDVIVHAGASCSTGVSLRDPAKDFTDNAVGTFNVCEASRQVGGIPVVFLSTVKVHVGYDGLVAPLGVSKRVGEMYLHMYGEVFGVPYVINRPSTVYGPRQDGTSDSGWVTWFIKAALEDRQITINGDGTQSRDILYVADFTRLLVDQVENFSLYRGGVYEIGGGPDNVVSLNQLLEHLGHTDTVTAERLPGDLQGTVTDNTVIGDVNGWAPTTSWRDGVEKTKEWLR